MHDRWHAGALLLALRLLTLHRADGGTVAVNPDQITSLRSTAGVGHLAPGHCVIFLTDGKFVAVLEDCGAVQRQLETLEEQNGRH